MFVAIKYNISVNLYYLGHFIVCLLQLNTIFPLIYIIFWRFYCVFVAIKYNISINLYYLGHFIVCWLQLNTIFP